MNITKEYYGDHLAQIHFSGEMIRCDFATVQPVNDGQGKTETNFRLVMNMQGFLRTFDTMQKLIDRMVESGILAKRTLEEKLDD